MAYHFLTNNQVITFFPIKRSYTKLCPQQQLCSIAFFKCHLLVALLITIFLIAFSILYYFFRLQQVDNGFFEKFGSLLREHSEFTAAKEQEETEKVKEQAALVIEANESDGVQEDTKRIDDEESTATSDSEGEEPDKSEIVGVGLNVSF